MDSQIVPGLYMRNLDGWVSEFTGIGDPNWDKRLSHRMRAPVLTYQDAIEMWRADDLAKRAIEAPIDDCFRQGYEMIIADEGKFDDLKEQIEEQLEILQFTHLLKRAKCIERALGGAAILIGANDHRPLDEPLDVENIASIDWLTVLEPIEIHPVDWYRDPSAAKYGEVEFYQLTAFTTYGSTANVGSWNERLPPPTQLRIHESRLVVFGGIKVSRYQIHNNVAGSLWGDSKLTSLIEVLRDFNIAWHAAGLVAVDFGQPVISVDNLMLLVAKNPADFQARMRALELGRSTARAIMIDAKKEKFERQSTTLTGLSDLLNALSTRLAAAVDMPLTRLMGMSPTGIGNEGTADVRFYYDQIKGKQTTEFEPLIRSFIKMLMSTIRKRKLPKKWSIKFHELWQMSETERAEARLTQARTDSLYLKGGVVYPDEIRKSRFTGSYSFETQIQEHKKAPGFVMPPPPGTPGSPKNPDVPANVHSVTSYTRSNPTSSGADPAPKAGDTAPGAARDAAELGADPPSPGTPRRYAGFLVMVEQPAGTTRSGPGWSTVLPYDYGFIDGATGADGEDVDVFLGPEETAPWVYVVHQQRSIDFAEYDEDKVMLGFPSADHAQEAYEQIYDQRFFGGLSMMPVDKFRRKIYLEAGKVSNAA